MRSDVRFLSLRESRGKQSVDYKTLLLDINRCPELHGARIRYGHPCAKIVGLQRPESFQAPEPWRGHMNTAPILFVSSNPSISGEDEFPPPDWTDAQILNHYQSCFDTNIRGPHQIDERSYNSVPFWREIKGRASEILGRAAIPGKDFALTELVHCKSTQEKGVKEAISHCTRLWLLPVMGQSAANIVVLVGRYAKDICTKIWNIDPTQKVHFGVATPGRNRAVIILPHPNARQKRNLSAHSSESERNRLRLLLTTGDSEAAL